jgi:hypothetical protein
MVGVRLVEEAKRRHALESMEKAKVKKHNESQEAAIRKQQNRLLIQQGNSESVPDVDIDADEEPSSTEFLSKQVDGKEFGAMMLRKMGWAPGKGLGKEGTGISDFIRVNARLARAGIGSKEASGADAGAAGGGEYGDRAKIRKITAQRYECAMKGRENDEKRETGMK